MAFGQLRREHSGLSRLIRPMAVEVVSGLIAAGRLPSSLTGCLAHELFLWHAWAAQPAVPTLCWERTINFNKCILQLRDVWTFAFEVMSYTGCVAAPMRALVPDCKSWLCLPF